MASPGCPPARRTPVSRAGPRPPRGVRSHPALSAPGRPRRRAAALQSSSWASSSTAQVWVAVASAEGSLTASSEYPGSGVPGSDPASPGRPAALTARSAGAFHGENWPGGYTGSGAPGAGGNPRTGPCPPGPAVRKAPALHSDPRDEDPPLPGPYPGPPWMSWPGRRSGRRHAFSLDGGPPLSTAGAWAAREPAGAGVAASPVRGRAGCLRPGRAAAALVRGQGSLLGWPRSPGVPPPRPAWTGGYPVPPGLASAYPVVPAGLPRPCRGQPGPAEPGAEVVPVLAAELAGLGAGAGRRWLPLDSLPYRSLRAEP